MLVAFAVIHVIVCLGLIGLVLLQDPKSGGAGGVFGGGGGSNSFLGATGSVTFLTKLTRYFAIIFGVTCLVLTLLSRPDTQSVIDVTPANAAAPVNATESNPATTNTEGTQTTAPTGEQTAPAEAPSEASKQ